MFFEKRVRDLENKTEPETAYYTFLFLPDLCLMAVKRSVIQGGNKRLTEGNIRIKK